MSLDSLGIEIVNISAPSPLVVGGNGVLECNWTPGKNNIYMVKWFLESYEFYRWSPKGPDQKPWTKVFLGNLKLEVNLEESREGEVSLRNVNLKPDDYRLRCEVNEEGPSFHTDFREVTLTIVGN